jgi:hypothetical protein
MDYALSGLLWSYVSMVLRPILMGLHPILMISPFQGFDAKPNQLKLKE